MKAQLDGLFISNDPDPLAVFFYILLCFLIISSFLVFFIFTIDLTTFTGC